MADQRRPLDPTVLADAIACIGNANADDPNTVSMAGSVHPRARLQGERAAHWLRRLQPRPDDALLLAAHAHHLRRWVVPRDAYPEGRAGYLRWRRDRKQQHAIDVAELLREVGVQADVIGRVSELIPRTAIDSDPDMATLEDVVCLAFLETQFAETADRLTEDKMIDVLTKTLQKMTASGRELAGEVQLDDSLTPLVAAAVANLES